MTKPIVNAFSPEYVSQLKPERRVPFKLPKLTQPPRNSQSSLTDSSAANEPDYVRRQRISKARI